MIAYRQFVAIVGVSMALAGCQSLGVFASRSSAGPAQVAVNNGETALAQGRQYLTAGRLAEAADAFRRAQREAMTMPEASNGLGVVYAKLKRFDLAERYFRIASSLEPDNARFAANLSRLEADVQLAQREASEKSVSNQLAVAPVAAAEAKPVAPAATAMSGQGAGRQVVRIAIPDTNVTPKMATAGAAGKLVQVSERMFSVQTMDVYWPVTKVTVVAGDRGQRPDGQNDRSKSIRMAANIRP